MRKSNRRLAPTVSAASTSISEENLGNQQDGSNHDCTIVHVEIRRAIVAHVKMQEVHHAAIHHTVPQIARGPTENQREADRRGVHDMTVLPEQNGHNNESDERKTNQRSNFPRS